MVNLASFWKPDVCGQTVLLDRSLLKELNWVGKAQLKNSNETWGVTSQQYGSWERWKGVVVVKVSYDMQINQHNGAGRRATETQFMCRTLIFYCFLLHFRESCRWHRSSLMFLTWIIREMMGKTFFLDWRVGRVPMSVRAKRTHHQFKSHPTIVENPFLTSNQVLSIHFSRGLFRSSCYWVIFFFRPRLNEVW